ncbi:MAG: sugar transferase [Oscillospiraceae bacterium]|nr:sugar transferase [Oscillospiraceae bacterium]
METIEITGIQIDGSADLDMESQQSPVIPQIPEKSWVYSAVKRTVDIVASGLGFIILLPLTLVLAALIYIDDPHGSPFFVQKRVGKDGREFSFYKLRSMVVNAEELLDSLQHQNEMDGPAFKIRDDPRITKIGKFIRKTSLDELPQLINVFKGDMSLVGPRPPLPREVAQYNDYQRMRLMVRPGLTCIWQIQPRRNDISFGGWVAMDIEYIQKRSLMFDLQLILKTFRVVVTGQGE